MTASTNRHALWWLPIVAAALAFLVAPAGNLIWDDQVVTTQQVLAFQSLPDILQPPPGIPQWSYDYYRPVVVASYLLDARLFGPGSAIGPHAMNVLYHMVATLFVWLLTSRLLANAPHGAVAAVAAATLFAVHPIHTESVSWISGRSDVLATALLVPALHLALLWRDKGATWHLLSSPTLFLLALLAKEAAIAGLAILPVLWLTAPRIPSLRAPAVAPASRTFETAAMLIGWAGATAAWWSLRAAGGATLAASPSGSEALLWNPLRAAAWYMQKLVVPWPQTNFATWEMVPSIPVSIALLSLVAGILAASLTGWHRKHASSITEPENKPAAGAALLAGTCWTVLAIAPSLAATVSGVAETPVAERYLYLPSVGFALASSGVLASLLGALSEARARRNVLAGFGALCVVLLMLSLQRGLVWHDDFRLWTDAVAKAPGYALPLVELGKAQAARGDVAASLASMEAGRTLKGSATSRAVASYNAGLMYAQRNDLFRAEQAFREAVATDPGYARGHYGLGRIALVRATEPGPMPIAERRALLDRAELDLQRALDSSPGFVDAWLQLARVLEARGDAAGGMAAMGSAEHLDPRILSRPEVIALRRALEMRAASPRAGGGG